MSLSPPILFCLSVKRSNEKYERHLELLKTQNYTVERVIIYHRQCISKK